jgi:hypothetical protein
MREVVMVRKILITIVFVITSGILLGCQGGTTTPPVVYSQYELEYKLISNFGEAFYCDPDLYPVARLGQEEQNALEQFSTIRNNQEEFSAILKQLGLQEKADYTTDEKVLIYREHKKLIQAVQMTVSRDTYNFTLRVGEGQGERIEGTITKSGQIKVTKREISFNTCPICLSAGTLIVTPDGPVPVEQLHKGMSIWTIDESGQRVATEVTDTVSTPVPAFSQLVRITLNDGRVVTASPGHPTVEGQVLGAYQVGDMLDGALIIMVERIAYDNSTTYDVLPSGPTGLYWANGILLRSTLWKR